MTVQEICEALTIDEVTCRKNIACLSSKAHRILEIEKNLE